jgi:hypothetical protein
LQVIHSLVRKNSLPIKIQGDSNGCDIAESEYDKFSYHPPVIRVKVKHSQYSPGQTLMVPGV